MVGLSRFELLTPRLSSVCSNQLSYRPLPDGRLPIADLMRQSSIEIYEFKELPILSKLDRAYVVAKTVKCPDRSLERLGRFQAVFSRKEVIQPQVLLQLPCYDFT